MKKKKTIETTGIVNNGKVKVTITDLDKEEEWLESATKNPVFKDIFSNDEDLYTSESALKKDWLKPEEDEAWQNL